jgi:hypothetical protein
VNQYESTEKVKLLLNDSHLEPQVVRLLVWLGAGFGNQATHDAGALGVSPI